MFGSLQIGRVRGIPIRLHFTLLLVFVLLTVRFGLPGIPAGIALFGSVLLHELGHSVVAQRLGIRISAINLHLLGGMAMMASSPRRPADEMLIAIAGPIVSLTLGLGLLASWLLLGAAAFDFVQPGLAELVGYAAAVNLGMAVFNMVPALPMDGGRVLRAFLSRRMGDLRATKVAGIFSRIFGGLFIIGGLMSGSWSMALIGMLLFVLIRAEERAATFRELDRRARLRPAWYSAVFPRPPFESGAAHGPVIDVSPSDASPNETREEFIDPLGRRYVIISRLR